jgi:hypothetical protein
MANVRQVVSNNNSDIVDFLLRNKFSSLSYDHKLFIKDLKRPRPATSNLVITSSKANSSNRGFCVSWYEKCKGITGREIRNRLFCWPCLLLSEQRQKITHKPY